MNILEEIVAHKRQEVAQQKALYPVKKLESSLFFESETVSFTQYLKREDKVGIIAEIKRSSPSAGIMQEQVDVERLSISYMQSGASALSILTDKKYFGGQNADLEMARKFNYCPILRKDFTIDEYQIVEAKSIGADCILLIAACLKSDECKHLASFARSLGLEVLLEVHDKTEIESHVNPYINAIGVNNRNLKTFEISLENSLQLLNYLPNDMMKVSESGIKTGADIKQLKDVGYNGFLIGGQFMSSVEPAKACRNLIEAYKTLA